MIMTREEAMEAYRAVNFNLEDMPEYHAALEACEAYEASVACESVFGGLMESTSEIDDLFGNEYRDAMENAVGDFWESLKEKLKNAWTTFRNFIRGILPRVKRAFQKMQRKAMLNKADKLGQKNKGKVTSATLTENEIKLLYGKYDAAQKKFVEGNNTTRELDISALQTLIKGFDSDAQALDKKLDELLKKDQYDDGKLKDGVKDDTKAVGKETDYIIRQMKCCMRVMSRIAKDDKAEDARTGEKAQKKIDKAFDRRNDAAAKAMK